MCETNDGFRIAEADLKLRGPGDLEGTQQSGIAFDLKIADIARDGQIVQLAREQARCSGTDSRNSGRATSTGRLSVDAVLSFLGPKLIYLKPIFTVFVLIMA